MTERRVAGVHYGLTVRQQFAEAQQEPGDWERCGVFWGAIDEQGEAWLAGCAEMQNVAKAPLHHYEFDAEAQGRTWERIEQMGYQVLGIWHTHPKGPEGLSGTDLEHAQPWLLYAVIWPTGFGVYQVERREDVFDVTRVSHHVDVNSGYRAAIVAAKGAMQAQRRAAQGGGC